MEYLKRSAYPFLIFLLISTSVYSQNKSLLFDGLDDKVVVLGNSAVFNNTNFTLEAWINATNWKSQQWQGTIIGKDQSNTTGFVLRSGANGTLSFTVGTGSNWPEITSNPIMLANSWHHVAAVMDNGSMKIYVDGQLESSNSGVSMLPSTVDLHIGESSGFSGRVFDGRIDEVRVWNVARSQTEIANNDTVNLSPSTPGLIAYYKMDQISGTNCPNEISTANTNGTLINFSGNPWVNGYEPTITDISADAIVSPNQFSLYGDPINGFLNKSKVKARFVNNGIDTITSFNAGFVLSGQNAITETVNSQILPGQSFEYTFNTLLDVFSDTNAVLKVFAQLSGDANALNDTVRNSYIYNSQNTIQIFKRKQHNFAGAGQSHVSKVTLPEDNTKYSQILMDISLECPTSGCDPWDQPAKISLLKNGSSYEIARFITPYGRACGPWTIDVTDFKSILRGSCEFASYIQVWGPSGWMLNVSLKYIEGDTTIPYQKITPLWSTDNLVYGDPGVSYDLPAKVIQIDSNTIQTDLRMTITGHGQANTDNAAEFSQKTHQVNANGNNVNAHLLWKADCAQNSCSNQAGTWLFARAGWCPGQGVTPYHVDLSNSAASGQNLTLDYILQPYTNFLNTGYNGSSHTEPHYKIHAFLVEKSNVYLDSGDFINLAAKRISSPVLPPTSLNPSTPVSVVLKNYGSTDIVNPDLRLIVNDTFDIIETYQGTISAGDSIEYTFSTLPGFSGPFAPYYISVVVNASQDQAPDDDVANLNTPALIGFENTGILDNTINLFPNPNKGSFTLKGQDLNNYHEISIYTFTGKLFYTNTIQAVENSCEIKSGLEKGYYLIKLNGKNGSTSKVLLIE